MKTRAKKGTNTSKNKESERKPFNDRTNNANTSLLNMKRKSNQKQDVHATKRSKVEKEEVQGSIKTRQSKNKNVATKLDKSLTPKVNSKNVTKRTKLNSDKLNTNLEKTSKIGNNSHKNKNKKVAAPNLKENTSKMVTRRSKNLNDSMNILENKTKTSPIKMKRLLSPLKMSQENNSDPYEFKFDPKEEPKRKPKKRRKPKKYDISVETSYEEDNSMKPIVKNIRKKIHNITPVERKLRNRLVKNEAAAAPKTVKEQKQKQIEVRKDVDEKPPEIIENPPEIIEINNVTTAKNMSVADEINEIANTFLEDLDDDLFDENSQALISSPSRIDIISNLIARRSKPPKKVFNSTMIHETPKNLPPQSPWRIEVSAIPKRPLNFSVKNKSFTPSYTPDVTYSEKKQSTLLNFVSRQPKTNLPVTLFQNSPSRTPFADLSNSVSPIRVNRSNVSPGKRSDNSLFGFSVLSESDDKENSPVLNKNVALRLPKIKNKSPERKIVQQKLIINTSPKDVRVDEQSGIDISIPLFEDLDEKKRIEKRYSRQYTRPQTKRKRNISFTTDASDSESEADTYHVKKKQKDVVSKEEAKEAERLASHYNSYFEEIENYPLCIE